MTTSRKLITSALRSIGVLPTGQVPSAVQADVALKALNVLMGNLGTSQLNTHTVKHQRFLMEAGKQYYTLGPGGDWDTKRPIRIEQAKLMKYFSINTAPSAFASFIYEFQIPVNEDTVIGWPDHNWYFRVYLDATEENLGASTLVTIPGSTSTLGDFITEVKTQLPGFECYFLSEYLLVLQRPDATFALEDGDGTVFPNPGYDYGIFDYAGFYAYIDNDSFPDSPFGEPLGLAPNPNVPDELITQTTQTLYYPLATYNDVMWSDIVLRGLRSGWPTIMYDDGNYPLRTLSFWPIPNETVAVELWTWEPLFTYENLDVQLDLPIGYARYLRLKLAAELAPEFGTSASPSLKATLKEAEGNIRKLNQQMTVVKMSGVAAALQPYRGTFNSNLNSGITAPRS